MWRGEIPTYTNWLLGKKKLGVRDVWTVELYVGKVMIRN